MQEEAKLVRVHKSTYDKLAKLGTVSDSMNDVIDKLIEKYYSCDNKKEGKK